MRAGAIQAMLTREPARASALPPRGGAPYARAACLISDIALAHCRRRCHYFIIDDILRFSLSRHFDAIISMPLADYCHYATPAARFVLLPFRPFDAIIIDVFAIIIFITTPFTPLRHLRHDAIAFFDDSHYAIIFAIADTLFFLSITDIILR